MPGSIQQPRQLPLEHSTHPPTHPPALPAPPPSHPPTCRPWTAGRRSRSSRWPGTGGRTSAGSTARQQTSGGELGWAPRDGILQLHCGSPADAHCGQALEQQQLPPGLNSIAWAAAVREPQQLRCPFTFMISCQVAPDSMPRIISASCSVSCLPPVAARAAAEPSAPSPALVPSATRQRQEGEGIRALRSRRLLRACTHVPTAHTQAWARNWQAAGGTGGRLAAAAAAALRTYDGLAVCGGCCLEYRGGTRHQQLRQNPRGLQQQGRHGGKLAWEAAGWGRRPPSRL